MKTVKLFIFTLLPPCISFDQRSLAGTKAKNIFLRKIVIFDALFYTLNEFASTYLNHLDENVLDLSSQCKYALLKTHYAPQIVHQNLAVFLWQLYSSKISFMGSGGCSQ